MVLGKGLVVCYAGAEEASFSRGVSEREEAKTTAEHITEAWPQALREGER